jgi:ATP-dependent exoDNAse (exonuclease V) alpha subunit
MLQEEALDILKMGHNVFLTGPAGSGKTYVLNEYIRYLKKHKVPVAITASTGIAATHMDGTTIHSWAGIGLKDVLTRTQLSSLLKNKELVERVNDTRVLIIDEISMIDAKRFDLINQVCQVMRKRALPFGGLQVVLCGDFFQLPPVPKRDEPKPRFCFNSFAWSEANIVTCYLEKQYRQNDEQFLQALNAIRGNTVTPHIQNLLFERYQKPIKGIAKPTKLYTHNGRVDEINALELQQLKGEAILYRMSYEGTYALVDELKKSCLAPEQLFIKKGAFVMFTKNNYEAGYVNGTLGTVIDIDTESNNPIVQKTDGTKIIAEPTNWLMEDDEGETLARIKQIPLRLAWAMTIHKSQGMSLDAAEIDLGSAFTEGMGYVALSRVRTLDGITLMGLNAMALKVNPEVTTLDQTLKAYSEKRRAELGAMKKKQKKELWQKFLET